jgi:hypothetical protein
MNRYQVQSFANKSESVTEFDVKKYFSLKMSSEKENQNPPQELLNYADYP